MRPHRRIFHLLITLFLICLMGCSPAQASLDMAARLSRLESEFFMVRSQINSLESQVYRLNNRQDFAQIRQSPEPAIVPLPQREIVESPNKQQFDRLATLLIELKEQINTLETRFSQLEAQFNQTNQ
jgi:chromosome segregation ATPase